MAHIFDVFALLDDDDDEDFYWDHPQRRHGHRGKQQQHPGRWVRADWIEAPDAHVIQLDLPGVKKDQIHVNIEDGRNLVISGEKQKDKPADKESKVHCYERFAGGFTRTFRLPRNAKVEEIHARLEDGVLRVSIPKTSEVKPSKRTVEIHGFGGEGRSTDISTGSDQPRVAGGSADSGAAHTDATQTHGGQEQHHGGQEHHHGGQEQQHQQHQGGHEQHHQGGHEQHQQHTDRIESHGGQQQHTDSVLKKVDDESGVDESGKVGEGGTMGH